MDGGRRRTGIGSVVPPGSSLVAPPPVLEGRWLRPGEAGAVVISEAALTTDPERSSIQTIVLVKRGERWSIAAFRNTRIQPPGLPSGVSTPKGV